MYRLTYGHTVRILRFVEQRHQRGAALRTWRESQPKVVRLVRFAKRVKCDASYLRRFELGEGDLSVPIATVVSEITGIPLAILLSPSQLETVRDAARLLGDQHQPQGVDSSESAA